jgi:acyl-CoA reductase-like NAD-dependent aldehyde dehydrogenase
MDQNGLWISPTVIVDVTDSDICMKEEIFGPILPILTAETPEEAIQKILAR